MNLSQFKQLSACDRVRRLQQDYIVVTRTDDYVCLIESALMMYTITLRFERRGTLNWIRHLYRTRENGNPYLEADQKLYRRDIAVYTSDSAHALKVATMYADEKVQGAVILDWYERVEDGKVIWRVVLGHPVTVAEIAALLLDKDPFQDEITPDPAEAVRHGFEHLGSHYLSEGS